MFNSQTCLISYEIVQLTQEQLAENNIKEKDSTFKIHQPVTVKFNRESSGMFQVSTSTFAISVAIYTTLKNISQFKLVFKL